jgi:uncharacterized membrane protein YphA (DoxX/SURF4 family)
VIASTLLLALRVALGGLFVFAAYNKLFAGRFAPETFQEAIAAYKVVADPALVEYATFIFPWVELLAGLGLILGFWTRASGLVIALMLAVFIGVIASVIFREIPMSSCSCFGKYKLLCGNAAIPPLKDQPAVGWCKVVENSILILLAAAASTYGGGLFSLDRLLAGPRADRPRA